MEKCTQCGKECKTVAGLAAHVRMAHKEEPTVLKEPIEKIAEKPDEIKGIYAPKTFAEIDPVIESIIHQSDEEKRIIKERQERLITLGKGKTPNN